MDSETITIRKDEYIELLRCKSALMENELAASSVANLPPRKPHSWMNQAEKAEIRRLVDLGMRPGEIAEKIGRSRSTIRHFIRKRPAA